MADARTDWRRIRALGAALGLCWAMPGPAAAEPLESMGPLGADSSASQRVVHQGEWAANLVEVLGLTQALPQDADGGDVFGLLCPDRAEVATGAGGRRLPSGKAFRVAVDSPPRKTPTDPVRVVVSVPATAVYMLSIEGSGLQRWLIDGRVVGHLDASELGVAQAPVVVPLRRGPHELTAFTTRDARVDRVELAAYRPLCIAPADGWQADRPLTFADQARTVVHALGIEQRLPESGEPVLIEAEKFIRASASGTRTHRNLGEPASALAWVTASGSPAEFAYRVRLEDPGVFTITARVHGPGPQLWSIDGRYRVFAYSGEGSETFAWTNVITIPLTSGEHVIRALIPPDSGLDVIKLVRRRSTDGDYLSVMEEVGFRGGAPAAYVTRSDAFAALSNPTFAAHAHHFLANLVDGEDPVLLVELERKPMYSRPLSPVLPPEL
jgi:hypothetical protein